VASPSDMLDGWVRPLVEQLSSQEVWSASGIKPLGEMVSDSYFLTGVDSFPAMLESPAADLVRHFADGIVDLAWIQTVTYVDAASITTTGKGPQ
jgi:hypothetical protein